MTVAGLWTKTYIVNTRPSLSHNKLDNEVRPPAHDAVLVLDILFAIFLTLRPVTVRNRLRAAAVARVNVGSTNSDIDTDSRDPRDPA